ncbi:tyrosine-protein kinase Fer isoform X4 [Amphiprion ocellaris]|uniref:tyrosine-protein kinase Fer isoform X4 n=1 Tax=Amphiprion ocellaris TaxID=80972 RepID=UPI002410EDDB|nr:tyrosine-protein kinase Fer isoform X4 [Amphiprion ocellaris]
MGFGRDLRNSHEGLLKLQDWELKLLETVKRFMTLRVKSDKEYAALLLSMTQQTEKQETTDYVSTVSKSWSQVVRQTEALGRIMRSHADDLNSGPLHRLATLIRDKQQVKKSYQSLHQQLESHNHKVTRGDLEKLKATYRQLSRDANNAKEKYREALAKGREAERARERYDKATTKLHVLHNQYVLAVCGAQTQQDNHRRNAGPALLDGLQRMQEDMTLALGVLHTESCIWSAAGGAFCGSLQPGWLWGSPPRCGGPPVCRGPDAGAPGGHNLRLLPVWTTPMEAFSMILSAMP